MSCRLRSNPSLPSRLEARGLERMLDAIHQHPRSLDGWASQVVQVVQQSFLGTSGAGLSLEEAGRPAETVCFAGDADAGDAHSQSGFSMRISRSVDEALSFVLVLFFPVPLSFRPHERSLVTRLGLHLENALRLARRPRGVRGWFDASGQLIQTSDDAPLEPAAVWSALQDGTLSLAPQVQLGVVRHALVAVPAQSAAARSLTEPERHVLGRYARGTCSKVIALDLGVSQSVVSLHLTNAATKLGVRTRRDLLNVAARLIRAGTTATSLPTYDTSRLTLAEQEVLEMLRIGLPNRSIARRRGRSIRTIANQVASLLRKTGCDSRRALAAIALT